MANSYYVNDLLSGQQTADSRMSWTLDPALRFRRYTSEKLVNGAWANAVTKVNHYGADNDEPRWVAEDVTQANNVTRNVESPEGDLALTTGSSGAVTLQLTTIHGDVMATVPVDPGAGTITGAVTVLDSDEFGMPSAETPAAASARYGWLGGKERSAEALGGAMLMGARVYDPSTGRFWQVDPEPGGNATAYDYCAGDPINCTDLDGKWGFGSIFHAVCNVVAKVAEVASYIPGPIGGAFAAVSAVAYAGAGNWSKAAEMGITAAASLIGANTAVKVAGAVVAAAAKVVPRVSKVVTKAYRATKLALTSKKYGPVYPRIFKPSKLGEKMFHARGVGARSKLFGDIHAGAKKPGLLNRGKKWAIGWSAEGTKKKYGVKGARAVFRVKIAGRHKSIIYGPWR